MVASISQTNPSATADRDSFHSPDIRPAGASDLVEINHIITSALRAWDLPDRLKRLALPLLHYDTVDLEDYKTLLFLKAGVAVAVAVLDTNTHYPGPTGTRCALLHGIYVRSTSHRQGIGNALQAAMQTQAWNLGYNGLILKSLPVSSGYFIRQGFETFSGKYPGSGKTWDTRHWSLQLPRLLVPRRC